MSKADTIAKALVARLQRIQIAAGYQTDAGAHVFRGLAALPDDALPGIIVTEAEDLVESQRVDGSGADAPVIDTHVLLPFVIEAFAECSAADQHAEVAHALVADIKRAVFSGDLRWGDLAVLTRYVGRAFQPRQPGTSLVHVTVQIRIGMIEDLAKP